MLAVQTRASRGRVEESKPAIDSLAVLPFTNVGANPETEYLSDGITESLINRLSQIPSLRVVPRSTAFRYKGRDIDTTKAGRQLKVQALLTGKVHQRGDTLNVQAELVDVKQNAQLWGDRFMRRVSDLLDVEDEIARRIAENLRLTLSGEERERLAKRHTESTDAYHLYLKGRYYWSKRTPPDLKKSVEFFEQAIAKDAGYALAYTGLADAYVVMSAFDIGVPTNLLSKAKTAALRALDVDDDFPEAHAELCVIWSCLDRDWDAAEDACHRAVKRQPGYWLAHSHYGLTLAALGRFDEAVAQVRRGQALDPLSLVVQHHAASVHLLARRYDEAIAESPQRYRHGPPLPNGASVDGDQSRTERALRRRHCDARTGGRLYARRQHRRGGARPRLRHVRTNGGRTPAPLRAAASTGWTLRAALRGGTRARRPRRTRRGRAMAGTGPSRSLVLVGLLGQSRSPAGPVAPRRSIQDVAASFGTRSELIDTQRCRLTCAAPDAARVARAPQPARVSANVRPHNLEFSGGLEV